MALLTLDNFRVMRLGREELLAVARSLRPIFLQTHCYKLTLQFICRVVWMFLVCSLHEPALYRQKCSDWKLPNLVNSEVPNVAIFWKATQ